MKSRHRNVTKQVSPETVSAKMILEVSIQSSDLFGGENLKFAGNNLKHLKS